MTNLFSAKSSFANSIKNSHKKNSHTKFISSSNLLENSDFKKFLELYLNDTTEFFERLDGYDGFISTQQVESINYENFEEHVFFDSAVEKINYAYDQSINYFPYDKSAYAVQQYIKSLDGFTKYVLDKKVEKKLNYLFFNGNTGVQIKDQKGSLLNDYEGSDIYSNFNPKSKSFSFDFWINPTNQANTTSCVFKKYSESDGVGLYIYTNNYNDIANTCDIVFVISDNLNSQFKRTIEIKTGQFQHVCFDISTKIENSTEVKIESVYIDGKKLSSSYLYNTESENISDFIINFSSASFNEENIYIGHSNSETINDITFNNGFIGCIDEFRFFISQNRSEEDVLKEINQNINARKSLVLYYRFNEPGGNYSNNNIVLDFSGNKLHGTIKNVNNFQFTNVDNNYVRNDLTSGIPIPLKYEKEEVNPILFSSFSQQSKEEMLVKAREYDLINPNSFWKLFPKNIFLESSDFDNVEDIYVSEKLKNPGSILGTQRSVNHEIIKLISIWARFFDQIKIYIDSFSEILNFSYESINKNKKIDGVVLPLVLNQLGFNFREIYPLPIREKLENKNLSYEETISALSIRQIQNVLWKRFILNSKDYLMSKGTKKSIKSAFNSFGLETDRFIRIRELTAQNNLNINNQFESLFRNLRFLDFNKHTKIYEDSTKETNNRFADNRIYVSSGEIEKSISNHLDFSDSWTYEVYIKFDKNKLEMFENNQSLFRIDGRANDDTEYEYSEPLLDVKFNRRNKEVESGNLILSLKSNGSFQDEAISNLSLFNGCLYHFVLRKTKKDSLHEYSLEVSPTGNLSYIPSKKIRIETSTDIFDQIDKVSFNIGKYFYTGDYPNTSFQGSITQKRFYSRFIEDKVINIKSRDVFYIGTGNVNNDEKDLLLNIDLSKNFANELSVNNSGKIIESADNQTTLININYILSNFSIQPFIFTGSDLSTNNLISIENILHLDYVSSMKQSNQIDSVSDTNKVYINAFESEDYKKLSGNKNISTTGQVHPDYLYHEDQRLYIDFSSVTFLNEDISKLISVGDYFTEMISKSSNLYEDRYVDLKKARDTYFKRLNNKKDVNFEMLYQVYKYFDNVLEDILYEAIPSRVNYLGFNFVCESHILERNKYHHRNENSRLPLSSSELLKNQNYDSSIVKYRYDDGIGFDSSSILKKV